MKPWEPWEGVRQFSGWELKKGDAVKCDGGWHVLDDIGRSVCVCPDEQTMLMVVRALNRALKMHQLKVEKG